MLNHKSSIFPFLAIGLVLLPGMHFAQQPGSQETSWRDWTAANQAWLRGQVTPNRVVPDPVPARRRLVVSYDIPPEEFPQGFHRSATYDNALAALAFVITGETEGFPPPSRPWRYELGTRGRLAYDCAQR